MRPARSKYPAVKASASGISGSARCCVDGTQENQRTGAAQRPVRPVLVSQLRGFSLPGFLNDDIMIRENAVNTHGEVAHKFDSDRLAGHHVDAWDQQQRPSRAEQRTGHCATHLQIRHRTTPRQSSCPHGNACPLSRSWSDLDVMDGLRKWQLHALSLLAGGGQCVRARERY